MNDMVERFMADCQARGLTKHSIESYKSCITDFLRYHKDATAVGLEALRDYLVNLRNRGLQGSTLKEYFSALSSFYDFLIFEGEIRSNPVPGFRKRYLRIKTQHGGENARQLINVEQMSRLIIVKSMKLVYAATILKEEELTDLKKKAKANGKDALRKAVLHYLSCNSEPCQSGPG